MTPEERWTKIEQQIAENARQIARMGEQMERRSIQIDTQIEKNTGAIRDLIAVTRTVVEAQQRTDKQLDRLIKTVDAFIKGFQKPNGNQ